MRPWWFVVALGACAPAAPAEQKVLAAPKDQPAPCRDLPLRAWTPIADSTIPLHSRTSAQWNGSRFVFVSVPDYSAEPDVQITGATYDPCTDRWESIAAQGVFTLPPSQLPRMTSDYYRVFSHWRDGVLYVWRPAGANGTYPAIGRAYDSRKNEWKDLAVANSIPATGIWVGTRLVAFKEDPKTSSWRYDDGVIYDIATDTRSPIAAADAPSPRSTLGMHVTVPLDGQLFVWGGNVWNQVGDSGGILDVTRHRWRRINATGAPQPRDSAHAVFTGREVIVWGGLGKGLDRRPQPARHGFVDGSRYDVAADRWTAMTSTNAPAARGPAFVAWTGKRVLVAGGLPADNPYSYQTAAIIRAGSGDLGAAAYDPKLDAWVEVPMPPMEWASRQPVIAGGHVFAVGTTVAMFDDVTSRWLAVTGSALESRFDHLAAWSDDYVLIIGGVRHGKVSGCEGHTGPQGCDPSVERAKLGSASIARLR